jgi:hypothetical protein
MKIVLSYVQGINYPGMSGKKVSQGTNPSNSSFNPNLNLNSTQNSNLAFSNFYNENRLMSMSNIKLMKPKYKNNCIIPVLPGIFNKFSTSL